jgi:quinol monooxygenase YgiN
MSSKLAPFPGLAELTRSEDGDTVAAGRRGPTVRIAEIEIDPAYIESYARALREGIEAAARVEPGVLALLAVSVRDCPERVVVFEVYADDDAYASHLRTPHFLQYKAATQGMVKSLRLVETVPIALGAKLK